jgi:hypothetical protein
MRAANQRLDRFIFFYEAKLRVDHRYQKSPRVGHPHRLDDLMIGERL